MTTIAPPGPIDDRARGLLGGGLALRRRVADALVTGGCVAALLVAAVPLLHLVVTVASRGAGAITPAWFTRSIQGNVGQLASQGKINDAFAGGAGTLAQGDIVLGMQPAIVGTLVITGLASLLAIPLGVLGAVYLNEYGRRSRPASALRFLTDVMTGVPSVVTGLFIFSVWVVPRGATGLSALAGALALACLMLPIVVRSTEEMLKLVPDNLREASAALGTRTWRTTVGVVIPAALPGITSGAMLAVARAAGETAPLLFTIGAVTRTNWGIDGVTTALPMQIYANATENTPEQALMAWGAALTLIVIVVVCTVLARVVTSRFSFRPT